MPNDIVAAFEGNTKSKDAIAKETWTAFLIYLMPFLLKSVRNRAENTP